MKERITKFLFISYLFLIPFIIKAQELRVTGNVSSQTDGTPLPGVSVLVQGTNIGTSTDASGNFSINVPKPGSVLVFSLIGMETKIYRVEDSSPVRIALNETASTLNEVVVVGYGTQKKSVVTGSISSVKSAQLEGMPVTRVEQALQGRTSGLTIAASSGQPGSDATIRVRGITTLNNNNPLWVVDGVVVDNGAISYINQDDIESIEVLKDAASQAIYGSRAAAGVILVTTKRGKSGAVSVNYNGFAGTQSPARKLDLLNGVQYATLRNEAAAAAGSAIVFPDPQTFGQGTDWQEAIFNNNAFRQKHEVSLSGGTEKSTFYSSFGYLDQEGIVLSDISKWKRISVRLNSTHKIKDWLTFGENLGYGQQRSSGIGNTNSEFGGPLSSAINLDPLTPLIETNPDKANASPYTNTGIRRTANGYPYGISDQVGQEMTNPLAYIQTRLGNYGWSKNIVGNAYLEAEPLAGLKFRGTLGANLAWWGDETFTPISWLNSSNVTSQTSFSRGRNQRNDWTIEGTASYSKKIDQHDFSVLLGYGKYMDNNVTGINVTYFDIPADNFDDASLNFSVPNTQKNAGGYENVNHILNSVFARLNYNYAEKYLLTAILRRDGSSRFGGNNKFGYFPSMSLGWVASNESFWPQTDVLNFLKIRGGYGVVGNDAIGDLAYVSTIGSGRNYTFGVDGMAIGYSPNAPSNPDLRWEETSQANIGFDAVLFENWNLTFDLYQKKTTGILRRNPIPFYVGAIDFPFANIADMDNKGVELELGYRRSIGDFNFSVNGNVSYLKNEITYLGNGITYLEGGASFQASTYPISRTAVGQPYGAFYGFKPMGIFQTPEEVDAYVKDGTKIQPDAKPGDFRWADISGDGKIDQADRTFIGDPTPDWSYGFTANAAWKNFDVVIFGQGVAGNQIFQGLRRLDVANANYQSSVLGRWTGPGTTNTFPRLVNGDPNHNFSNPSSFYLEDGDYFRIKTLQLGYSLPSSILKRAGLNRARVYVMSENLVTFTKYTGYDPEIGGASFGIDRGIYPQARSFMLGLQFGF